MQTSAAAERRPFVEPHCVAARTLIPNIAAWLHAKRDAARGRQEDQQDEAPEKLGCSMLAAF